MTIGIVLGAWLLIEVAGRLALRALERRRRRWIADLPEDERLKWTHLDDQTEAVRLQVGPWAFLCATLYAELMVQAEELPPGEERSRLAARALRWERRADRLRRDRVGGAR